mgnify:CR=1 FL=1
MKSTANTGKSLNKTMDNETLNQKLNQLQQALQQATQQVAQANRRVHNIEGAIAVCQDMLTGAEEDTDGEQDSQDDQSVED